VTARIREINRTLPPGIRAYPPVAMRDVEVFCFVLGGEPDLWLDGQLCKLVEGQGLPLNAGTGIAHTILNNATRDVRLFVMSEAFRHASQAHHPLDRDANVNRGKTGKHWQTAPLRKLGPHDGLTDAMRGTQAQFRRKKKAALVSHWRDLLEPKPAMYDGSNEPQGISAKFGKRAGFSRIGVHVEILKPGRRSSWPHAERDEVKQASGQTSIPVLVDGDVVLDDDDDIIPYLDRKFGAKSTIQ